MPSLSDVERIWSYDEGEKAACVYRRGEYNVQRNPLYIYEGAPRGDEEERKRPTIGITEKRGVSTNLIIRRRAARDTEGPSFADR